MGSRQRLPSGVVAAIQDGQVLGLRAGTRPHRFIGLWAVVVEGRVFVRSWSLKPRSWYRTFLEEPQGAIQVGGRELAVRAVHTRSERLKQAVDAAYLAKYHTPSALKYARDLTGPRSRDTTTELLPYAVPAHRARPSPTRAPLRHPRERTPLVERFAPR